MWTTPAIYADSIRSIVRLDLRMNMLIGHKPRLSFVLLSLTLCCRLAKCGRAAEPAVFEVDDVQASAME